MSRILIVDDDNDFSGACEAILTREGYDIVTANSVPEAEKIIQQGNLDLILLDIMIENPDDGIFLSNKLHKDKINIPVIMLSGVSKVTGYQYSCDEMLPCADFIEKPVTPDVLIKKVKSVIEKKS